MDTQDYTELRPIGELLGQQLLSKPGTFGWNKLDEGSLFLLQELPTLLDRLPHRPGRVLDLGCGYGLLTVGAAGQPALAGAQWLATDNCAAALIACARNATALNAEVFAGDCGLDTNTQHPLRDKVDFIVCNPPFHQGFQTSGDLTRKFLQAMQRWLTPKGAALLVVNQFIGLEKKAAPLFTHVNTVANNGSFKLVWLQR